MVSQEILNEFLNQGLNPQLHSIGAVGLYSCQIVGDSLNKIQSEMKNAYDYLIENDGFAKNDDWNTHHLSDVTFSENMIEKYEMNHFWEELQKHLILYYHTLNANHILSKDKIKYRDVRSWMTLFKQNEYAHIHSHGTADVSGVYYFKTSGDGKDGILTFPEINVQIDSSYLMKGVSEPFSIEPKVGTVVLFPGWVRHGVGTNVSGQNRVSFSFNLDLER